jgi:GntR family transcriptional regulator, transcriptional repressor for pyruvate dehydrogenase complex
MSEMVGEASPAREAPSPKAASLVAAQIRKQIVLGELAEGDLLPSEAEMVKRLGVSRPTLRQAFRILETEHLITVQRGARGGTTVLRPSVKLASRYLSDLLRYRVTTLGDVLAARLMIEPAAVAQLARRRDEAAIELLESAVREQRAVDEGAPMSNAAEQFHVRLVELAGNPVLSQYCTLINYLIRGQIRRLPAGGDGEAALTRGSAEAHEKLVGLLAAGAAHAAAEHWREHLADVHARLGELLDLDSPLDPPD